MAGVAVDAGSLKFDDAAAPAGAGAGTGGVAVDPSALRFDEDKPAAAPAAPVGGGEAFLRGAKQGFTLGFGDEISGALESAFTDKTYAQARDEARAADTAAQGAHPWLYGGGNVAGGVASALVPGLGAAKAATLGAAALRGAATGGIAALGGSDADLGTAEGRSQALGEVGAGAAAGGVLGAVGHGVGKWLAAAPARAEAAEVGDLKLGVNNARNVRTFGQRGQNEASIREALREAPDVKSAIRADPEKALDLVDTKVDQIGKRLGAIYQKVQEATPEAGIPLAKVDAALADAAEGYAGVATKGQRDAITALRKEFAAEFGGQGPGGGIVPVTSLHREVSQFAKQGFEGGPMFSIPVAKQLKRDVSGALRDLLQDHVDEIATAQKIPGVSLKILQGENQKFGAWRGIQDSLAEKVGRARGGAPPMGEMISWLFSPLKLAGKAAAQAAEPVDRALAPLVRAAPGAAKVAPEAARRGFSGFGPTIPSTARAALDATDEDAVAER